MKNARAILAGLLLATAAHSASAALFDDDEARKRIAITNTRLDQIQKDLEARLGTLEQQLRTQGLDLFSQMEAIKGDLARLRGQIEVLTHELAEAQKRQKDLYVDLDTRMRKLEGASAASAPAVAPGAAPGGDPAAATTAPPGSVVGALAPTNIAPPAAGTLAGGAATGAPATGVPVAVPATPAVNATEQRAYDGALDQFKRGDYVNAIAGFNAFVKVYPKSPLAPSAQYWVGNAQFARKDYRAAVAAQRQLIQTYPDSSKVPDALLNIASAQSELGENAAARRTLEELTTKYPQSEAAGKAKQRLGMR